jgi:hypothetical protein
MDTYGSAHRAARRLLFLALVVAAVMIPHALNAKMPEGQLCVSALCDDDSVRDVLSRNLKNQVEVVLRSGEHIVGVVEKVTPILVHLSNLEHRNYFDAVIDMKEIAAVIMKVRASK